MARHPINTGRFTRALTRFFQLRGVITPTLDDTVVPTVSLGQLGESQPPAARRAWVAGGRIAAVAGQFSGFGLEVPPGTLAVIDHIMMSPAAGTDMQIFFNSQAAWPGAAQLPQFMDARLTEGPEGTAFPNSACVPRSGADAVGLGGVFQWSSWMPVTTNAVVIDGRSLGWMIYSRPDNTLSRHINVATANLNTLLDWSIAWTEYSVPEIPDPAAR